MRKRAPGTVQIKAEAFSAHAQRRPLDWDTPMRGLLRDPDAGDFVWHRLQYVFRLPNPHALPALGIAWTQDEREMLMRFVEHAETLAGTSLLGAKDGVTVRIADDGLSEEVDARFSDPDVTTGFATLLRQCYMPDEEASFSRVRKVLGARLHALGDAALEDVLKQWRRAHVALHNKALEELIQERMVDEGLMPAQSQNPDGNWSSSIVRGPASPDDLLRAFWYGGQIHWGDQRETLSHLQRDPFEAAWSDIHARQCALELAHFYIGFAVLVRNAVGEALRQP